MLLKWFKSYFSEPNELRSEELDYISAASIAVLHQNPRGGRVILWILLLLICSFFIWANFAKVEEFTRGEGKVIPSQQVQLIQNLEGGILSELFVSEGQIVERGQVLLRIDDTRFASSLREADITLKRLQLRSSRLRDEAEGKPFSIAVYKDWPTQIVQQEIELYNSRRAELNGRQEVLMQQLTQKQQEQLELLSKIEQLKGSVALLVKELSFTQDAADEGAVSEVELLRLERQVNDLRGDLEVSQLARARAQSTVDESEDKLKGLDLAFRSKAREELNETTLELSQLTESAGALADRVSRTSVISPVAGTVKRILASTIGGVIQPGVDIIEIVPSEEILLVEAKIRPSDIAYLYPGLDAVIRFSAYDFSLVGGVEGKLVQISPDTIEDDKGNSFYLARIETSSDFVDPNGKPLPIIPGMTVSVDMRTGEKTIMSYLLKPLLKTKQLALRER
jgi:adhesin transport system membrane fusion protein